jgi:hypothetical protein
MHDLLALAILLSTAFPAQPSLRVLDPGRPSKTLAPNSPKVPTYQPGHRTSADACRKFATPPGSRPPVPRHPSRRRRRPAARRRLVPAAAGLPLPRASSPSCGSAARTPTEESCNVCPEITASQSSSDCCISISLFCSCCYCCFFFQ